MRRRLTKRSLKQIPTKKFVKGEDPETCPICLDDFEENEKLRILPCGHAYHCQCIDPWLLKTRRVCPICKRKVLPGRDDSSDSEAEDSNGGAGPSRLASASERTPLLASEDRGGMTVGNSTFYGVCDRSSPPDGNLSPTPPLNRGRPVILSPASTPDAEEQHFDSSSREPLIESLEHESDENLHPGPFDNQHSGVTLESEGHVNPNFVEDTNSLTVNADEIPKGERV